MNDKSEPNQPRNDDPKAPSQDKNTSDPSHNHPLSGVPAASNPKPTPSSKTKGNDENHAREIVKEVFEWFAIVAAIGLMLITYFQLKDSQETRILDERAWVCAYDTTIDVTHLKAGVIFQVTFKNTGKTPALRVRNVMGTAKELSDIPAKDEMPKESQGLLAPDESSIAVIAPASAKIIAQMSDGKTVYLFGTVWYDDIFGNHHWSQFCKSIVVGQNMIKIFSSAVHNSCDDAEQKQ
jgi:hypothetical protein